jgi:hypothetical protein
MKSKLDSHNGEAPKRGLNQQAHNPAPVDGGGKKLPPIRTIGEIIKGPAKGSTRSYQGDITAAMQIRSSWRKQGA